MIVSQHDGSFAWRAMASPVALVLPGLDAALARAVALAVQEDLEATEQALSRFRPSADLVQLNRHVGAWGQASPRLYAAVSAAYRAYRQTGGLFDPRVLVRLEEYGYTGALHKSAVHKASSEWLERMPRRRALRVAAPLDLGGIGKGLGLSWASRIARRVSGNYVLNAGGDLVLSGTGPDHRGWTVGIEDPNRLGSLIGSVVLCGPCAVCTSSTARHRWQSGGEEVHHLIDPRSGRPGGQGLLAVTVIGGDPAWAEVWSKTLFLQGAAGIERAAAGRAALWITEQGKLHATPAARTVLRAGGALPRVRNRAADHRDEAEEGLSNVH